MDRKEDLLFIERLKETRQPKIILFRALQLGDLLCTVPAFRALRAAVPEAHITLAGLPWQAAFVQRFSHLIDDFIEFPGWPGFPEREPVLERVPTFLQSVQGHRFDAAIQMQGSGGIANPLIALFGARLTAGFSLPGQYRPNDSFFPTYPQGLHEIEIFLHLIQSLGIPAQGKCLEFPIQAEDEAAFSQFCRTHALDQTPYICIHPGARFTGRRWSPDHFAAVGDALAKQGYRVLITGTESEAGIAEAVIQAMQQPAINAAGQTDLGTLALLIQKAALLICNDTGVSHISAAMQTPSVVLFTVSEPSRWRPLNHNLHHAVQNADQIAPEVVISKAFSVLRKDSRYAAATS
jgi:ADP-heptose:LPS heptosyltransferase